MHKKLLVLSLIVLFCGNLSAATWDGEGEDDYWHNPVNWAGDVIPSSGIDVIIKNADHTAIVDVNTGTVSPRHILLYDTGGTLVIEPNGTVNSTGRLQFGSELSDANGIVDVNGGTLNLGYVSTRTMGTNYQLNIRNGGTVTGSNFYMGTHVDSESTINIDGGTLTAVYLLQLGYAQYGGTHNLNMTSGQITTPAFKIGIKNGTVAHFQFDGGTVNVTGAGGFLMGGGTAVPSMDLTGDATLIIAGDSVSSIETYIDKGYITSYGGDGTLSLEYDGVADETTLAVKCTSMLTGDFDNDCVVGMSDLDLLTDYWLDLTYAEVYPQQPDAKNLRVHYTFDEGTGTVINDSSSNGFDTSVYFGSNGSWDVAGGFDGGNCIDFSDSTEVDAPEAVFNTLNGEITYSFWANIDTAALDGSTGTNFAVYVIGSADTVATAVEMGRQYGDANEANVTFLCGYDASASPAYDTATGTPVMPVSDPILNGWHHYGFTKNAATGTIRIYIDGVMVAEDTGKSKGLDDLRDSNPDLNIGYYDHPSLGAGGHFNGKIDEFRVYDYELSQAEIVSLAGQSVVQQPIFGDVSDIDDALVDDELIDFLDFAVIAGNWLNNSGAM